MGELPRTPEAENPDRPPSGGKERGDLSYEKVLAGWEIEAEEKLPAGDAKLPGPDQGASTQERTESELALLRQERNTLLDSINEKLSELAERDADDPFYQEYKRIYENVDDIDSNVMDMNDSGALTHEQHISWLRTIISMARLIEHALTHRVE